MNLPERIDITLWPAAKAISAHEHSDADGGSRLVSLPARHQPDAQGGEVYTVDPTTSASS